jgi:alpha-beta hydrolase superfamily lysophospholipase
MPSVRGRRRRHTLVAFVCLAAGVLVLAVVALAAGAWYFSSQLLDVRPDRPSYSLQVLALHRTTIELPRTGSTQRPGVYAIDWPDGRAVLGPLVSTTPHTVLRRISGSIHGLKAGEFVDFDVAVYASPAGLHERYRTVSVVGPLGPMPAWYMPGRRHTWVILVHGYKANRTDPLRAASTLGQLGLPVLDLSYRNDVGAPPSPDHLYHLGATEWQDVQAGVRFAIAHGAQNVVLYGFSMGGGIVETFLHRSSDAPHVRAVVLDAPALDWGAILDLAARQRSVPGILTGLTQRVIAWRIGVSSLDEINWVKAAVQLKTPTLIFHGQDDGLIPIGPSEALARARPDLVTLVQVAGAGHTESWNLGPARYDTRLKRFLTDVLVK